MATELATAYISLVPSLKGAKRSIETDLGIAGQSAANSTERSFKGAAGKVGGHFKSALKLGIGAGLVGLAAGAGAIKSVVDAASDLEEARSKVEAVFGPDAQKSIEDFASKAATTLGQSKQQVLDAVGGYGNLLTSFGVDANPAAEMSKNLTGLASDLASFNNTSVDEALAALQSGLTGETEPLKKYGVALDDASLKAKALAMGISDGKSTLTPAAKAQAAYALIMERTTNAQGDFARTSGGLANQQKIFKARFDNLKVSIGKGLLPVVNKLLPVLGGLFDKVEPLAKQALPYLRAAFESVGAWWKENGPQIRETAEAVFGRIAEVVQAVVAVVRERWPQIQAVVTQVMATWRTVISGALEFITSLWRNFGDNILNFVRNAFGPLVQVVSGALEMIRGVVEVVLGIITGDWSRAWEGIKSVLSGAWDAILGIIGLAIEAVQLVLGAAWEVISSAVSAAWEGIKTAISTKLLEIAEFVMGVVDSVSEAWDTGWTAMKDLVSSIWDGMGDGLIWVINGILAGLETGINLAIDMLNMAIDAADKALGPWINFDSVDPIKLTRIVEEPKPFNPGPTILGGQHAPMANGPDRSFDAGSAGPGRSRGGPLIGTANFNGSDPSQMTRQLDLLSRRQAQMVPVL